MYAADLRHPDQTLEQKLHAIYALNRGKKIDLSFRQPYPDLLHAFGNPHLSLPPVTHVAGTNGKGSIVAIMRSILEKSGYKVHAYTSPHLLRFNERIVLAGQEIEDSSLEALIDEARELNEGKDITFFEITTAIAFAAFSRVPSDILLLETGLGGRLDCTNIIEKPQVTIINQIAYDHTKYLGESLKEIAAEKAGIMKKGVPCIIGVQSNQAIKHGVMDIFAGKAAALDVPLYRAGQEWGVRQEDDEMLFVFEGEEARLPLPNLEGAYQIDNAGAALAALKIIENTHPLTPSAPPLGLGKITWGARLQHFSVQDLKKASFDLPEGWELWLDGGHNDRAGYALSQQAALWEQKDDKPLHIVLGMKTDKNPAAFLTPLLPYVESLSLVDIGGVGGSLKTTDICPFLKKYHISAFYEAGNVREAVRHIVQNNERSFARILVCGSLYLAEQVY
ncbi:MAG: bifunctional folylpolyglutamate synthase/dihydrofolate synthase [Micavibrio sp.]|nr:MAG: bifunctional folylpolyglutamate synthase/dihydrofolate synthase [Micavibrio sp.]